MYVLTFGFHQKYSASNQDFTVSKDMVSGLRYLLTETMKGRGVW
jgi:hypothetical protein